MTITDISSDLENKDFSRISNKINKSTAMDQLILELDCTNYLQERVDYVNKHLKNFRFRLVMDEVH